MPRNTINDLRNHLFEVIEKLQDGEIEVSSAKAINDVAKTIVGSAKVEVSAAKVLQRQFETSFLPEQKEERVLPASLNN